MGSVMNVPEEVPSTHRIHEHECAVTKPLDVGATVSASPPGTETTQDTEDLVPCSATASTEEMSPHTKTTVATEATGATEAADAPLHDTEVVGDPQETADTALTVAEPEPATADPEAALPEPLAPAPPQCAEISAPKPIAPLVVNAAPISAAPIAEEVAAPPPETQTSVDPPPQQTALHHAEPLHAPPTAKPEPAVINSNRIKKRKQRRSAVSETEDIAILRAVAAIQPHRAAWGLVKRRWQQVANRVVEELAGADVSDLLCQRRYETLVQKYIVQQKLGAPWPMNRELRGLLADAVEDKKQLAMSEGDADIKVKLAFQLLTSSHPPQSVEELQDAVADMIADVVAPDNAQTSPSATAIPVQSRQEQQQHHHHHRHNGYSRDVNECHDEPRRVVTPLATPTAASTTSMRAFAEISPSFQLVSAPPESEPAPERPIQRTHELSYPPIPAPCAKECEKLKLDVAVLTASLAGSQQAQTKLKTELEALKVDQTRTQNVNNTLKQDVASLQELLQDAASLAGTLRDLHVAMANQQTQFQEYKQAQDAHIKRMERENDARREETEQLRANLQAVEDKETMWRGNAQDDASRRQVGDGEIQGNARSLAVELAELRAALDTERSDRMRTHVELLDNIQQIFFEANNQPA